MGEVLTKQRLKDAKTRAVGILGKRFYLLRNYDDQELVRRAIIEYNYRHKGKIISLNELQDIMRHLDVEKPPEGYERIFVIHNHHSQRRGLSCLLGAKGYEVASRDPTVLGTLIRLANDVRRTKDYDSKNLCFMY